MDVLELASGGTRKRLVLRRYDKWYDETGQAPGPAEMRSLQLAYEAGIPAPEPIWIDTEAIFEQQAIVLSFLDGSPLLTPEDPIDWARQIASALCRVHEIPVRPSDAALIAPIRAGEDRYMENEQELTARHPLGESLWARRMELQSHLIAQPAVFLHSDYWPGNTMWLNQELVSVIDWEGCGTGDPAFDVAYCAADMRYIGHDTAADIFVATYIAETGRELTNLKYWELVSLCRPMPDLGNWIPSWNAYGLAITKHEARARHAELIRAAISS